MFVKNKSELIDLGRNEVERRILTELIELTDFILSESQPSNMMSSSISVSGDKIIVCSTELDLKQYKNCYLIAFGKASQKMTKWMLEHFSEYFSRIIIVSPDSIEEFLKISANISFYQAGHPKPTSQSVKAAEEVVSLLEDSEKDDLCLFLISGGGSALLEQPAYNIPFTDYETLVDLLLSSNASIQEINTIRKHFSKIKGGKLAQTTQASIVSIILSDVLGNDVSSIASGPTAPDSTTWKDCHFILSKYSLLNRIPRSISVVLEQGKNLEIPDTPSEDELFEHVQNYIIGDNLKLQQILLNHLHSKGDSAILNSKMFGESKEIGQKFARQINDLIGGFDSSSTKPFSSEIYQIFGGETTVTLDYFNGIGGRNQELALSFALSLGPNRTVYMLSLGTDGIDGNSSAAGAIVGPFTLDNEDKRNKAHNELMINNSNSFFKKYGGEIITGYTGTNLMDIGIIVYYSERS